MKKKIEIDILFFILLEAVYLLFFFKTSILNILIGTLLSLILIYFINKIKNFKLIKFILLLISIIILIITLQKVTNFITFNILKNYSKTIILLTLIFTSFNLANKGYHSYIKSLEISSYFYLLLKIVSFILIIFNIEIGNYNVKLIKELSFNFNFIHFTLFVILLNNIL